METVLLHICLKPHLLNFLLFQFIVEEHNLYRIYVFNQLLLIEGYVFHGMDNFFQNFNYAKL